MRSPASGRALDNEVAAVFDRMPAHTPRQAVVAATALAREAGADLIVTVGGSSITNAAKAVQLCLADDDFATADGIDTLRDRTAQGAHWSAADRGPDHALGRRVQRRLPAV